MKSGTVLAGRFEILAQVGQGGMGSVFRARDRQSGHTVAVKILTLSGPHDLARFTREASLLAHMNHPHVVRYIAHGSVSGIHYLAEEWIDGVTLGTQVRTIGVTAREALAMALGIARGLGHAHRLGVIHRDIKPSNIILTGGDPTNAKLVDFGIARLANEAGVLTRTGVMVGTPSYMSPEQARGQVFIDAAADVWSLGCVLYEALAGRTPFSGSTPSAIRAKVLLGFAPPLEQFCPEAPDALRALVLAMFAKLPIDRPQNGDEVAARIVSLPPIPDGPRRKLGPQSRERATDVLPMRPKAGGTHTPSASGAANCYVLVTPLDAAQHPATATDQGERIALVAAQQNMEVHGFDDGSALLASREVGKAGAVAAAMTALALRDEVFDGAVSVFGRAHGDDTINETFDRGSGLLEQATMSQLFGEHVGAEAVIPIDDVIVALLQDDFAIAQTEHGPALATRPRARTSGR